MNIYFLPYQTVSVSNVLGTSRARPYKFQFKWGSSFDGFASGVSNRMTWREKFPLRFFFSQRNKFRWIYFIIKIGIFCLCNKCLKRKMLEIWIPLKLVTSFQFESNWIVHDILEMYDRFFSRSFCAAFSAACRSISYDSLINHQRSISFDLSAFFIFYLYLSRCINGPYPGSGSPMKCKCTHTHSMRYEKSEKCAFHP